MNIQNKPVQDKFVIEASWEICNKVGGIYTVIMSKAALIDQNYTNYLLIGPYIEKRHKQNLLKNNPLQK